MTEKHLEKIGAQARKIYNCTADSISSFLRNKYEKSPEDTLQNQIGDFHLIAERACVHMMGNVLDQAMKKRMLRMKDSDIF